MEEILPPESASHCYNCDAACQQGEFELEYWRGRENGFEAETVCLDCYTTHTFGEFLSLDY